MKAAVVFVGFLLQVTAVAQQHDGPVPEGAIYGIAIGQDGQPAKGIELNARPLGVLVFRTMLDHTRTNDAGEYRFENLDWGKYTSTPKMKKQGTQALAPVPPAISPLRKLSFPPHTRRQNLSSTCLQRRVSCKSI